MLWGTTLSTLEQFQGALRISMEESYTLISTNL